MGKENEGRKMKFQTEISTESIIEVFEELCTIKPGHKFIDGVKYRHQVIEQLIEELRCLLDSEEAEHENIQI